MMRKRGSLIAVILILAMLVSACGSTNDPAQTTDPATQPTSAPIGGEVTIRVAPDGDDSADGVSASVATVERALTLAKDKISSANVTIEIGVGTYSITQPLSITNEHTDRDNGFVLTLRGSDKTVISGGVSVTGWQQHEGNIWKTTLANLDAVHGFYVDGENKTLARTQISGTFTDADGNGGIVLNTKEKFTDFSTYNTMAQIVKCAFTTAEGYGLDGAQLQSELGNIRMYFDQTFARTSFEFSEVTENNGKFTFMASDQTLKMLSGAKMADYDLTANLHYLVNSYLFLNEEGEYYFDKESKTLYYCSETSPENSDCVAAVSEGLLNIQGIDSQLASNIRLENLTFAYGTDSLLAENPFKQILNDTCGYVADTEFERCLVPAQITLDRASNLTIDNCTFENFESSGVALREHVYNTAITNCDLRNISGTGIVVGTVNKSTGFALKDNSPHPEDLTNVTSVKKNSIIPAKITISGNTITNCGIDFIGSNGIMVFYGYQVNVHNNTVEKIGGTGIGLGWGLANYSVKREATKNCADIIVEGNKIVSPCMRIVNCGGIGTLGAFFGEGLIIRGNFVDMTGARRSITPGIYLDDGSEFITVTGNVAVGADRWLCARAMPATNDGGECVIERPGATTIMNCTISGNFSDRDLAQKEFAPGVLWPLATEVGGTQVIIENNTTVADWQQNDTVMAIVNAAGAK